MAGILIPWAVLAQVDENPPPVPFYIPEEPSGPEPDVTIHKGAMEAGICLGLGIGMKIFGSSQGHDWGIGTLRFGYVLTDLLAEERWYQGHFELLGEVFGGKQFLPNPGYMVGFAPLLRYDFVPGGRWVPFIDLGAGVTGTNIRDGDLSKTFEFNLQLGLGTHYFLSDNLALTMEYRYIHLSDGGISSPNRGVNTSSFLFGVTWFF